MYPFHKRARRSSLIVVVVIAALVAAAFAAIAAEAAQAGPSPKASGPKFSEAKAFDVSKPLRELAKLPSSGASVVVLPDKGHGGIDRSLTKLDGTGFAAASFGGVFGTLGLSAASALSTSANFEGISNQDNFNIFGFRVNPPDPVGDVGPNHYVEMVNLAYAVYSKTGTLLAGPADTGSLCGRGSPGAARIPPATRSWSTTSSPIAGSWPVHDAAAEISRGRRVHNCVAISKTGDPTGAYYRYAFTTGNFFPDYPKYGVWTDSYVITTREFGPTVEYGISVYAIDRDEISTGAESEGRRLLHRLQRPDLLPLVGDGLLPADVDGKTKPKQPAKIPLVGTQDDDYFYGATSDALNIWELDVHWNANAVPDATLEFAAQLPVASFDSNFPCAPTARDCLRSRGSRIQPSISTSSRTASGRPGVSPTATSARSRRW